MASDYSVAFIGCGKRARAHAAGVKADARLRVVGLCDINPVATDAMNADHGFAGRAYVDHVQMLTTEKPDVAIVSLWTPLHLPIFRDCVNAGVKAVLCEKPMTPTWGHCLEMAELAEASRCQLTFCHQRRFAKGNQQVRQWIREGRIGRVERMDLYSMPNLLDCGTHSIDQAMSFNGESPVRWALGAVDASAPIKWFNVSAETMCVGTMVFQNDVRAHLQVGGPDMDMKDGVRIHGSEGFIQVGWNGNVSRAVRYDDPSWKPELPGEDPASDHMIAYVRNAIDSLERGVEPELSHRKALRAAEAIFALYESVRRHVRIELPLRGVNDNPFITMLDAGRFRTAEPAAL